MMTKEALSQIRFALEQCTPETRRQIFDQLRKEFPIHALEAQLNTTAEVILEAIARASSLTLRGIKGIIAEAYFQINIVSNLESQGWKDVTNPGDLPYDFALQDAVGTVKVQVKNQRSQLGRPKLWKTQGENGPIYVAETQRTRTGKSADGSATRPYKFGDFDVLAVCMQASTANWADFRYTVARWLLPRRDNTALINVYQPVLAVPNADWCDDFQTVATWFRSSIQKTIWN